MSSEVQAPTAAAFREYLCRPDGYDYTAWSEAEKRRKGFTATVIMNAGSTTRWRTTGTSGVIDDNQHVEHGSIDADGNVTTDVDDKGFHRVAKIDLNATNISWKKFDKQTFIKGSSWTVRVPKPASASKTREMRD